MLLWKSHVTHFALAHIYVEGRLLRLAEDGLGRMTFYLPNSQLYQLDASNDVTSSFRKKLITYGMYK